MTKQVYKSIAEIDDGGIMKKMDYELSKVMASINDVNADRKKGAEITLKIKFKPDEDAQFVKVNYDVKGKLCPICQREITLLNSQGEDKSTGEIIPILKEFNGQATGQLNLDGDIHEPLEIMYGVGAEKCIDKETIGGEENA